MNTRIDSLSIVFNCFNIGLQTVNRVPWSRLFIVKRYSETGRLLPVAAGVCPGKHLS